MKRQRSANDDDGSDDELFVYSNKQKLTFSAPTNDNFTVFSSSSESSSDDEEDVVVTSSLEDHTKGDYLIDHKKKITLIPDTLSPPPSQELHKENQSRKTSTRRDDKIAAIMDKDTISLLKNPLTDSFFQDDDDVCIIDEQRKMKLKIRVHGVVEKYEIDENEPLKNVIADIAQKENVVPGHVTLNWGSKRIDPQQSAASLQITIADILECLIYEVEIVDKQNMVKIKIQSEKQSQVYEVRLEEAVECILKDFSEKCDTAVEDIRFSFDGDTIRDMKTSFSKLDMVDGDVIDAALKY